jgi:tRNA A37 threonylcarbamoyladenosine dehydratase
MTDYLRQQGIFNPVDHPNAAATIVGCGGIGSFTAVALAKMGFHRLHLIDFDTVEEHNLPNQFFPAWTHDGAPAIGQLKTEVLKNTIVNLGTGCEVSASAASFDVNNVVLNPIVIAALDSMEGRKELFELVKMKLRVKRFIDGRLAGQKIVVYSIKPSNIDMVDGYASTLYSDEDALQDSCTERGIIDVGFSVASLIARQARRAITGAECEAITYYNHETLELMRGDVFV